MEEQAIKRFQGRKVVVVGGSGSVGGALAEGGASVLATARGEPPSEALAEAIPGLRFLAVNAVREDAPEAVFAAMPPDVLVVTAGASPPTSPVHELSWTDFSRNWKWT
jgi:NAD(P)-dependent dehydrogenase (short-subunit alcohol dehydrogenase family)